MRSKRQCHSPFKQRGQVPTTADDGEKWTFVNPVSLSFDNIRRLWIGCENGKIFIIDYNTLYLSNNSFVLFKKCYLPQSIGNALIFFLFECPVSLTVAFSFYTKNGCDIYNTEEGTKTIYL